MLHFYMITENVKCQLLETFATSDLKQAPHPSPSMSAFKERRKDGRDGLTQTFLKHAPSQVMIYRNNEV